MRARARSFRTRVVFLKIVNLLYTITLVYGLIVNLFFYVESIRVADARMIKNVRERKGNAISYLCAKFQIDRDRYRACGSIFLIG